ncbi:MAG: dihydroorotase [Gammaproteobacteria bacterium]|nr:dihydroorotase [Gammaproteobacteria bacterium]
MQALEITTPDDWHLHLRDGALLEAVLPHTSAQFARAIVMPNLIPPVRTAQQAQAYRQRILNALPVRHTFEPLMTCYLTDSTDPNSLSEGFAGGHFIAAKLYPAGATTNSDSGVSHVKHIQAVLERMAEIGMPLLVHGEVTDPDIDVFDREAVFIEQVLSPLHARLPQLKIVFEHVTTADAVDFVRSCASTVAATITTHHLMINRNTIFKGGVRPHYYCLPIAKRECHRQALRAAATSAEGQFFLGTDSAPHLQSFKESACGCAGLFTAPNALSCLAHVFEEETALERLEAFTSLNGPAFYGLPANRTSVRLIKRNTPVAVPKEIMTPDGPIVIFDPQVPLHWHVESPAQVAKRRELCP